MEIQPPDWKTLRFTCIKARDIPVDPEAESWFQMARAFERQGNERNGKEMVALYKRAAERGHHKAQLNLAGIYIQGTGVTKDEGKAADLVEKALQQNSPRAFYLMGVMLQQGVGVKLDGIAALSYFRKAADMGDPYGQLAAGEALRNASVNLTEQERRQGYLIALSMLNCALTQELPEAGHLLGRHYLTFEKDSYRAIEYFQKAAALGYNDSLYRLYSTSNDGEYGFKKDPQRAACYYNLRKQLLADPEKRFPDIDRLCPLPPSSARTSTSSQPSPRSGLWHQAGRPTVMFRAAAGDSLPLVDGVLVQWEWEATPFEGSRLASGQMCPWQGTWACEDLPIGGREFAHGETFPEVDGRPVTWRRVPRA